ncbi:MAG TPA: hypothetical protein VMJ66_14955 [Geobacteraceae bacterium]|nr:hypothetical protein [Geobacteraceae bacterium]
MGTFPAVSSFTLRKTKLRSAQDAEIIPEALFSHAVGYLLEDTALAVLQDNIQDFPARTGAMRIEQGHIFRRRQTSEAIENVVVFRFPEAHAPFSGKSPATRDFKGDQLSSQLFSRSSLWVSLIFLSIDSNILISSLGQRSSGTRSASSIPYAIYLAQPL